jgi:flagellar basal body-associated protein FliL
MDRRQLLAVFALGAAAAPAAAQASAKKDEKKKGGGLSFIQIQTLAATINRRQGGRGVVTVETGLDISDAALRERAELSMPRLRSAFNGLLQQYVAGLSPGAPVNADYLAQALQRQTDTTLGKRGARLLIGSILMN